MRADQEQPCAHARLMLEEFFDQIRFARATELAQAGRFPEAEGVLSQKGRLTEVPRELDLLARMSAHQGRFQDARRFWEAALQKAPGDATYQRCLERLAQFEQSNQPIDTVLAWSVWLAIACGVAVLFFACFS